MHCLSIAKLSPAAAIDSAANLERIGAPLLDGLTAKVQRVLEGRA